MTLSLLAWERTRRGNVRELRALPERCWRESPWGTTHKGRLLRGDGDELAAERTEVFARLREQGLSYPQIALQTMGRRSAHTTVWHSLHRRWDSPPLSNWQRKSLARTAAAEKTNHTLQGDGR